MARGRRNPDTLRWSAVRGRPDVCLGILDRRLCPLGDVGRATEVENHQCFIVIFVAILGGFCLPTKF